MVIKSIYYNIPNVMNIHYWGTFTLGECVKFPSSYIINKTKWFLLIQTYYTEHLYKLYVKLCYEIFYSESCIQEHYLLNNYF